MLSIIRSETYQSECRAFIVYYTVPATAGSAEFLGAGDAIKALELKS